MLRYAALLRCLYVDSKLPSVFPKRHFLDIVDEKWITDTLSDDEIEVPPGAEVDPNNAELEPVGWAEDKVDRWNDLGLDLWAKDHHAN
ncbi:hypothetical protein Poli38472_010554 [Pythium oligandrum]|uniref:Anaphase-promoting complex subunit 13 n=1 Tax=Pythium oligandrum TaxID=41045 RepID=A0A8K1C3B2_PYTOL|nr:hypothetical protein Poli38472_010554 [Pythium oligandrum]|eukprot:TMW55672.1 hypothetical protein Poli38472_010554 [Pythium oligandrum]